MTQEKERAAVGRPGATTQPNGSTLPQWVQDKLKESGITNNEPKVTCLTLDGVKAMLGGAAKEGFFIPYMDLDGRPIMDKGEPFGRVRFEGVGLERKNPKTGGVKHQKYGQKKGSSPHVYFPPGLKGLIEISPLKVLVITEGELKAMSGVLSGIPTAAIGGVWVWADPTVRAMEKEEAEEDDMPPTPMGYDTPIHPELMEVIEAAKDSGIRKILVLGDSDGRFNGKVQAALSRLGAAIQWQVKDVEVRVDFCPCGNTPEKQGLDDWLVVRGALAVKGKIQNILWDRALLALDLYQSDLVRIVKWALRRHAVGDYEGFWFWRGDAYLWEKSCWIRQETESAKHALHRWLDDVVLLLSSGRKPVNPTLKLVDDVWQAMTRENRLPDQMDAPVLFPDRKSVPETISFKNGILVGGEQFAEATPEVFTPTTLPYDYDKDARCPEWETFLGQLWGDDPQQVDLLQEWVGYLLSGKTNMQKILLMIGPPRAGKGTILKVLTGLVGAENTVSGNLASLGDRFVLQEYIGKSLAVFPDVRLNGAGNQGGIVERLLSISGEDQLQIDRKNRPLVTAKLGTRLVLCSNELPKLVDASGAQAERFSVLRMVKSFLGNEDIDLAGRLLAELPGILNWGLTGLKRLEQQRRFTDPNTTQEFRRDLKALSSPVHNFVEDCCELGPDLEEGKDALYLAWTKFAGADGHHSGSKGVFSRNLCAAYPDLKTIRPRIEGTPGPRKWSGIKLIEGGNKRF